MMYIYKNVGNVNRDSMYIAYTKYFYEKYL